MCLAPVPLKTQSVAEAKDKTKLLLHIGDSMTPGSSAIESAIPGSHECIFWQIASVAAGREVIQNLKARAVSCNAVECAGVVEPAPRCAAVKQAIPALHQGRIRVPAVAGASRKVMQDGVIAAIFAHAEN